MQFNSVNKKIVAVFLFCFGDYFPSPWACAHISAPSTKQPLCLGVLGVIYAQMLSLDPREDSCCLWTTMGKHPPCEVKWGIHTWDDNRPEQVCVTPVRGSAGDPSVGFYQDGGDWKEEALRSGPSEMFTRPMCEMTREGDRGHAWTRRPQILRATHQKTRSPSRGGAGWGGGERGGPRCSLWGAISKFTPKTVPHQGADLRA